MATKYKLPYTGDEIKQKFEKIDNVVNQITDPDNYPLEVIKGEDHVITLEVGKLSRTDGSKRDGSGGLRTPDFIAVNAGEKIYPEYEELASLNSDARFCFLLYDNSYNFISTAWNDEYCYAYANSGGSFTIPNDIGATYLKGYLSVNNTEGTLTFKDNSAQLASRAEHKKIYIADHGYSIYGDIIDDETMHKIVIEAEGIEDNSYNITEIKAPSSNPQEATVALMNWGNGTKQFVDFSSMTYNPDDPTVEIVCQTRGGQPLPEFSVRYNDGNGAGRVKKLVVSPDAIPMHLTAEGLKVRRNNNYNNSENEEEYVTINLANLYDTVNELAGGEVVTSKDYIAEEARRVADVVHENMTANSFVFAALTDCHYNQNDNTQAAIKHTAEALYEIQKNVSLDAIALLGDFVRGDDTDTAEDCNNMLVEIRKEFYDATRSTPSLWAVGNHDNAHYYTKNDAADRNDGDAMYSYLGSNNKNTVVDKDNRQKIYGYRDFETQKIRMIYCNTVDVFDNTSTSSAGVSNDQLAWLTSTALDFTDKENATEWGVILLSHHPLEWSSSSTKKIITVINDYINGEGDFSSVPNRAEIIAAFHGHTHNFIANNITDINIPSIGIPQVCYGRYNEYAEDVDKKDKFGEFLADGVTPVYYTKLAGSAQETSFNVITIDRKARKIYCTNYGAGRDREYNFTGSIPAFEPTFVTPVIENGMISSSSGENEGRSGIRTADYINCEDRATYMFVTNDLYWCLLFYDENYKLLKWNEGKTYKYFADGSFRVPAGAKYMKLFCEDTTDTSNAVIIHNIT